jgi:hypothetical protein
MDLVKTYEAAKANRLRVARELWDILYEGVEAEGATDEPEEVAFDAYRSVVSFPKGYCCVVWRSDGPEEAGRKINQILDGKFECRDLTERGCRVARLVVERGLTMCPTLIERSYALLELYVQIRMYEHPGTTRKDGFLMHKDIGEMELQTNYYMLFGRTRP